GEGQTIAIVDAYDDPNIFSDADTFDKQFHVTLDPTSQTLYDAYGAASTWLTKVYAQGSRPRANSGWAGEIALDVEWAHAIAPKAAWATRSGPTRTWRTTPTRTPGSRSTTRTGRPAGRSTAAPAPGRRSGRP